MSIDYSALIDGYLDESLAPDEVAALEHWLKERPENARQFAAAAMLHDRLRGEHLALGELESSSSHQQESLHPPTAMMRRRLGPFIAVCGAVIAATLLVMFWKGLGETPASAAVVEINRIIAANAEPTDRTYQIAVERAVSPPIRGKRPEPADGRRPPKPPLDGAVLYVRGGQQFVLERKTTEGLPFVTGSNGRTSWAVRPDGPVRSSSDLARFNRDLPGHEHSMPLISIHDGLKRLLEAYEVQLLPVENADAEPGVDAEPSRLLVAVKQKGFRGPQRVEISYSVRSGLIREMRFVDMPYGPERLTLRMTLVEERQLGADFFDHESHHAPELIVEEE